MHDIDFLGIGIFITIFIILGNLVAFAMIPMLLKLIIEKGILNKSSNIVK